MKRFHVHVAVPDLAESIGFYARLFGAEPAVRKHDYAKWMLDDPRVNFAISQRGGRPGVNHLGFQVDSDAELEAEHDRLVAAGRVITAEKGAACCYARSDKYWVIDSAGVAWETFHSLGSIPLFGADTEVAGSESATHACCEAGSSAPEENRQAAARCCGRRGSG